MTRTDFALIGAAVIVTFTLLAAAANRSAEAYSLSLEAGCSATVTAAAVIELSGADCRPESGHPPAIVELCRITHGRTALQVAKLPQCRKDGAP